MQGFAIDTSLAPEYPGIENTEHISDWNPPFPVNLKLIRPIDEEYWDQYHAAPKAIHFLGCRKTLMEQPIWKLNIVASSSTVPHGSCHIQAKI